MYKDMRFFIYSFLLIICSKPMFSQISVGEVIRNHITFFNDEFYDIDDRNMSLLIDDVGDIQVNQKKDVIVFFSQLGRKVNRNYLFIHNQIFSMGLILYNIKDKERGPLGYEFFEVSEFNLPITNRTKESTEKEKQVREILLRKDKEYPHFERVKLTCRKFYSGWKKNIIDSLRQIISEQTDWQKKNLGQDFLLTVATIKNGKVTYHHYNSRLNTYD